jgi:hypothetical protein
MAGNIEGVTNLSGLTLSGGLSCTSNLSFDGTQLVRGAATFGSTVSSVGLASVSGVSVAAGGLVRMTSGGTIVIRDAAQSWRTVGTEASIASIAVTDADNGVWAILHQGSGLSLCYRSAGTLYFWSSTASKVAG